MRNNSFYLQFSLILGLLTVIEGKHVGKEAGGKADTFIAAVYEHLPILALPVCYEKGKRYKEILSFHCIRAIV